MPAGLLVVLDRDDRLDAASPQVAAVGGEEQALSASARPGRLRGRPAPRRGMRMNSISGMNRGQPACWPGEVSRAIGRQRRPATRRIMGQRGLRRWRPIEQSGTGTHRPS
jgi:hypothetical protein